MKVTENHVAVLSAAIAPLDTSERRAQYRAGKFPRAGAVKDLDKRYRWDLFWAAFNVPNMDVRAILATGDYNDAHIDTALRTIVKPINE